VAMLDVVANTDPSGSGVASVLAELRGTRPAFGGVDCVGPDCRPIDDLGNPVDVDFDASIGYWWPRITLTFVLVSAVLTVASMRLVVPAGMRWAFRRRRRVASGAASPVRPPAADPATTIEEMEP
ncbi:MAG TPA: hypothetical protein VHQ42_03945, partial [Candidatus Limnocylindria bacterium]|nr:hypothetical protein [Candidatus Limnocylindria bacterium]